MLEYIQECPICQSSQISSFLTCKDYTVSQKEFQIVRCDTCSFTFTNPRPSEEEIGIYYQSEAYVSHSNTSKGIINLLYQWVRKYTLQRKITLIKSLCKQFNSYKENFPIKVLDVGCGTGLFLKSCKKEGWEIYGTEPDPTARQKAESETQASIQPNFLTTYLDKKFDIITLWHVLEHIHRLDTTLEKLYSNLAENGHLIIAVPNLLSWDAKKYQHYWAAYDLPRHLYHFNQYTLELLLKKFGFKIVAVKPMLFDAYYVSMLSTKYRTGSPNYLEAIFTGLQSNWRAANNHNNYSSLIYHVRKDALL